MFKKITLVTLFLVCFTMSIARASARLERAQSGVISLIQNGNYAQAEAQTQRLLAKLAKKTDLSGALCSIAMEYELVDKYDVAKDIYQQILRANPGKIWESKAELGVSRMEVLSLIMARDSSAETAFDKLLADFTGHPDLAETLYYVARRYEWAANYEKAKDVYYLQIKNGHYDSPYTAKAKLGAARTNILSLIMLQNNVQAKKAFDKLVVNFAGDSDLPDTLYWIGRRYEWGDNYEEAMVVYRQLAQGTSEPYWIDRSTLGYERANILFLILSQDFDRAKDAYNKLLTKGFTDHPDFPATLYWIARRYEWGQKYVEANNIYQKIIDDYPNDSYLSKAKLGLSRTEVASSLIDSPEQTDAAFHKLVTEFDGHPDLATAILASGQQCYRDGLSKESAGLEAEARERYKKAVQMWEKLIKEHPNSSYVPETCCRAGDCYYEKLNRYKDSVRCFQKVADKYPQYQYAWHAQLMVGRCYEVLKKRGAVDEAAADEKITAAYQRVKKNYSDCPAAGYAGNWLSNRAKSKKER